MRGAVVFLDDLRVQLHPGGLPVTPDHQETVLIIISHIRNADIESEVLLIHGLKIVLADVIAAHRNVFKLHVLLILILDQEFSLRLRAASDHPAI